ncbi:Oidioi.mRNA.OKI2018_I69.chr2.g6776.t1.cds [Oikopleura dioica]|uniref:Oidioi.mRNA.OKI2018_I69.chr2.g6776.t1.cds n=1 Tax=Oikopleura dioica TaxID=34765 RepID=A0ABN7TAX0_OIKDI|nr:Oidioi.mRNA.OKI2018_I69.chr2.g6776.t1.cds [Oikopleura dioica]
MRFEVGFVLMSIVILVFRSCYTVYWEERQKKKKEKKLKEDIEMMQKIGKSTDNVFKVNTLEKNSNLQVVTQSTRLLEDEDNVF